MNGLKLIVSWEDSLIVEMIKMGVQGITIMVEIITVTVENVLDGPCGLRCVHLFVDHHLNVYLFITQSLIYISVPITVREPQLSRRRSF